jgi:signal transduction histidine kinase/ActR/RegA family two-component response regulator
MKIPAFEALMRAAAASICGLAAKRSGNSSSRLVWPLALACGFLIFVTGSSVFLVRSSQTTGELLNHALQVDTKLWAVLRTVRVAESGQRGYLLTGDAEYLDIYHGATGKIGPAIAELKVAIIDPVEHKAVAEIEPLIERKFAELGETIRLHDAGQGEQALALVRTGIGRDLMEQIRTTSLQMLGTERRILDLRSSKSSSTIGWLLAVNLLGLTVIIVFSAVSIVVMRRLAEKELAYVDELERSNHEHCRMQNRIAEQRGALDIFARALAHDLKEPVRTIRTLLDLVRPELSLGETTSDHLQSIRYAAERMNSLIDTVYFYTRLDGAEPAEREVFSANALVEAAAENISHLVSERQAVITCSALPEISVNREQLVQVFQNLLSNAIQNCATVPRIDTTFDETPDHWLFRVSDNGTGIAKQDTETLFMPFKRMSHHKMQGPGLGLATCRKIIELHGGKIWFETKPTNGTDFIFSVAKGGRVVVVQTAVVPSLLMTTIDEGGQQLATLLLVDDDDMAIELIQIGLLGANRLHCNVIVARDGHEALARLHDSKIDLVLLDINMPRMDGFELLVRMRDESLLDHIAVVMCSTSTYQDDISKAKDLGASGYLTKPPDLGRLRSILKNFTTLEISEVENGLHLLRTA